MLIKTVLYANPKLQTTSLSVCETRLQQSFYLGGVNEDIAASRNNEPYLSY